MRKSVLFHLKSHCHLPNPRFFFSTTPQTPKTPRIFAQTRRVRALFSSSNLTTTKAVGYAPPQWCSLLWWPVYIGIYIYIHIRLCRNIHTHCNHRDLTYLQSWNWDDPGVLPWGCFKTENPHSPRIEGFPTYQTIEALTTSTHIIVFKYQIKRSIFLGFKEIATGNHISSMFLKPKIEVFSFPLGNFLYIQLWDEKIASRASAEGGAGLFRIRAAVFSFELHGGFERNTFWFFKSTT